MSNPLKVDKAQVSTIQGKEVLEFYSKDSGFLKSSSVYHSPSLNSEITSIYGHSTYDLYLKHDDGAVELKIAKVKGFALIAFYTLVHSPVYEEIQKSETNEIWFNKIVSLYDEEDLAGIYSLLVPGVALLTVKAKGTSEACCAFLCDPESLEKSRERSKYEETLKNLDTIVNNDLIPAFIERNCYLLWMLSKII